MIPGHRVSWCVRSEARPHSKYEHKYSWKSKSSTSISKVAKLDLTLEPDLPPVLDRGETPADPQVPSLSSTIEPRFGRTTASDPSTPQRCTSRNLRFRHRHSSPRRTVLNFTYKYKYQESGTC